MRTVQPSRLLRTALVADATVSGAAAVLQLAAADWLNERLLLPRPLLAETGILLVAYTAFLVVLARRSTVWSLAVAIVVGGNVAWGFGCIGSLATGVLSPNAPGSAFLLLQAAAVFAFAALEYAGLKVSMPLSDNARGQGDWKIDSLPR